ncbi:putative chlorophyll(ide) b reductase NYC1, chloroplastic [Artemisia annua]|uniref:Putative chlorophyll(Ide) b reductase NYC1, chloroplastic n=1 Tax=Artemisia annua TaxID=35608 RepID=A0A2U1N015_ARTAN|nr:putative chlorophyll(ide) b reductase NYC1, chloroplastic [Artemisia annua]
MDAVEDMVIRYFSDLKGVGNMLLKMFNLRLMLRSFCDRSSFSEIYGDDDEHWSCFVNRFQYISWVGGIVIGTMIGSNMVLDEVSQAGPRNVVITGRGLGKALAREFLLSGDRVVIASRMLGQEKVKHTRSPSMCYDTKPNDEM